VLKKTSKEMELTTANQGSGQNGLEKRRWSGRGWNQAVAPI